ncbi:hypothetical protein C8R46DRAFT_353585 [Mycena filopes]|nr:hypothetical protein C8R46DRAFT_353585 [Mycena filopes]
MHDYNRRRRISQLLHGSGRHESCSSLSTVVLCPLSSVYTASIRHQSCFAKSRTLIAATASATVYSPWWMAMYLESPPRRWWGWESAVYSVPRACAMCCGVSASPLGGASAGATIACASAYRTQPCTPLLSKEPAPMASNTDWTAGRVTAGTR